MTEYEVNKEKVNEYRKRNKGSKTVEWLCKIIEWFNERCIKISGNIGGRKGMRKVSREELYKIIATLDVVLSIQGEYPYKTVFKYRDGKIVGVDDSDGCCYLAN